MRVDLDDAVLDGDTAVPVNAAARLDALHQKAELVAQRRIVGHDVNPEGSSFIWKYDQLAGSRGGRREAVRQRSGFAGRPDGLASQASSSSVHRFFVIRGQVRDGRGAIAASRHGR